MLAPGDAIRTDRLTLLPLEVAHADEMAAVLSDPALHEFIGGEPESAADLRVRYERLVAGSPDPTVVWWNWVIRLRDTGELVGTVQATVTDEGRRTEIAWVVGTHWQGQGIATEAAGALVDRLFTLRVHTVTAHIHPDHAASTSVARAAGLSQTDQWRDGEVRWVRTAG